MLAALGFNSRARRHSGAAPAQSQSVQDRTIARASWAPEDASSSATARRAAAFAFEAAIAALTHKLAKHIEGAPRRGSGWAKFSRRYLNAYAGGLLVAVAVSTLANLAHSVEFGRPLTIFGAYSVPPVIYSIAFGAILPAVSFLFARVLSNAVDTEAEEDQALVAAKEESRELRRQLRAVEAERGVAEERARAAETRFAAAGDLFARIFAQEKRERILAIRQQWPALPAAAVAIIAEASPSYVSEVLAAEE